MRRNQRSDGRPADASAGPRQRRAQLRRVPVVAERRDHRPALLVHVVPRQPDRSGTQDRGTVADQRRRHQHRRPQRLHRGRKRSDDGGQSVRGGDPIPGRLHRMGDKLGGEAVPPAVRRREGTHPPVDSECEMSRPRRLLCALMAALAVVAVLAGCTRTTGGAAWVAGSNGTPGSPETPRNDNSQKQYPNLLKECDVLTTDMLAKTVGADPLDIPSTFVGAVCRWQAANPDGLIDITRFWYEQGSLDNEKKVAQNLKYQIENRSIAGVPSIVMKPNDPNGSCGVASDAAGVVGWWFNPQVPGIDACAQAIKLMELTLS